MKYTDVHMRRRNDKYAKEALSIKHACSVVLGAML